jgi:hypothetical protein
MRRSSVHGVYDHGTAGECYAETREERKLVNPTVEGSKKWGSPVHTPVMAEVIGKVTIHLGRWCSSLHPLRTELGGISLFRRIEL